ncbi:MAG: hypothetical protein R2912_11335 [Eubacteriales bacterium]
MLETTTSLRTLPVGRRFRRAGAQVNPDVIVTIAMYFGEGQTPVEEILSRPGWQDVTAVKNGDIFNLPNNELNVFRAAHCGRRKHSLTSSKESNRNHGRIYCTATGGRAAVLRADNTDRQTGGFSRRRIPPVFESLSTLVASWRSASASAA